MVMHFIFCFPTLFFLEPYCTDIFHSFEWQKWGQKCAGQNSRYAMTFLRSQRAFHSQTRTVRLRIV